MIFRALLHTFFYLGILVGCQQSAKVNPKTPALTLTKPTLDFFESCSRIDTTLNEIWILLCQKDSHPTRQELYEYSRIYKTFRRLTYQDGLITDVAVHDFENIFYASTYDEAKERFVEALKGEKPGTDVYLKKRGKTEFQRLTNSPGLESQFFWSPDLHQLFFVHRKKGLEQIVSLDRDSKMKFHHVSKTSKLESPVVLKKDRALYWLETAAGSNRALLMKKSKSAPRSLWISSSKVLLIRPEPAGEQLLVAFATGLGRELWAFHPDTRCWQQKLRTTVAWDYFHSLNENEVFLSLADRIGLQLQTLLRPENTCEPSPPGLGVETTL